MASWRTNFAKLTDFLNQRFKTYHAIILLKTIVKPKGFYLVLVTSMGALLLVLAASGWKLRLDALLVNKANLAPISSNGFTFKGLETLLIT